MMNRCWPLILIIFFALAACSPPQSDFPGNRDRIKIINHWAFYYQDWEGVTTPDTVKIPHKWPNKDIKTFGYSMYRAKLTDPGEFRNLAVRMPNILSAYAFTVNGDTLQLGGRPSKDAESEEIRVDRKIVIIPEKYYADGKIPELTLYVSNHNYHVGGFLTPLVYGEYEVLNDASVRQSLISGIQSGALGLMSMFLLVYYFFRRKESYILFFSLLSFGLGIRILIVEDFQILELLPGLDGEIFLKLVLTTFYLGITLNYAVLTGLFPKVIPQWSRNAVFAIGGIAVLFVIITPLRIGSYSVPFFQLFSIIAGIMLIGLTFKAAIRHHKGAKTVLVGTVIALSFIVNDILFNNQIISTGNWSSWGVLIYLFLLIVVISRRFSSAMENEETLNMRIRQLNSSLEERIEERTRNLSMLKEEVEEEAKSVKEANDQLLKFKEEEQSQLRILVHDLKAPFNKIKGLAQILRMNERYRGGEEKELNEMILKVAEQGRLLIDDLNVLTMYEAHVNDIDSYEDVSIHDLLKDSVRSHAAYAKSKDIKIEYHNHHHIKSWINPNMLSRIVDNLLSNAIKFSPNDKTVKVELIKKNDQYEINICDNGPGFTEEDKEKMYGKFQRLSARPTQGEASTGLGLSIVKNLTDLMGGEIKLETSPGKGSCFQLTFPVRHGKSSVGE